LIVQQIKPKINFPESFSACEQPPEKTGQANQWPFLQKY